MKSKNESKGYAEIYLTQVNVSFDGFPGSYGEKTEGTFVVSESNIDLRRLTNGFATRVYLTNQIPSECVKDIANDIANSLLSEDPEIRAMAEFLHKWKYEDTSQKTFDMENIERK